MATNDPVHGLKAKVHRSTRYATAQRIYNFDEKITSTNPRRTAEAFLKRFAADLGIDPDLKQLKFDKIKDSVLGKHVLFQQRLKGKAISNAWVRVDVDPKGRVFNVQNDLVPVKAEAVARKVAARTAKPGARTIAKQKASDIAHNAVKAKTRNVVLLEQVYWPHDGVPVLAWKTVVTTLLPAGEWRMYIDAITGKVLEKVNMLKRARGRVFDPNPVATMNDASIKPEKPVPMEAYRDVELPDVKNGGFLDGPYVSTKNTRDRVKRPDGDFRFTRDQRAFKEVMVYFHIDRVRRHLLDLGFTQFLNTPIAVNIDGTREDNSFYSPNSRSLTFGTGGVDDAEDAEVILHEYGHAIQDAQVPGWGMHEEGMAMGEGFGDFLAASFFAARKPKRMRATVFNYDAVAYSDDDPPCLRRLDSKKKYPKDIAHEEHDDGEIWSACLWELRTKLGRARTEKLVIAHHELLTRNATFADAVHVMLTANLQLSGGKNDRTIRSVFQRRGLLEKK